jgi:hypothetical protein
MTESDYLTSFSDLDTVIFRQFRDIVGALGASRGLYQACHSQYKIARTGRSLPSELNGALYLAANPDVAEAKMPALMHYYCHGKREGRRLHP